MRQLWFLALGLALLGLAGCGGAPTAKGPWEEVIQSEGQVLTQALALADQMESQLGVQSSTTESASSRPITLVRDNEEVAVLAQARDYKPPQTIGDLAHTSLGIVIKCTNPANPPVRCGGYWMGNLEPSGAADPSGTARIHWRWRTTDGRLGEEIVPAQVELGPQGTDPTARQKLSYNKIGVPGFWADSLIQWPFLAHIIAPSPLRTEGQAEFSTPQDPTLPFLEALQRLCCGLPTEFPKSWPPAVLMREDIVLAFVPFENPRLATAASPDDLVNEPLGLLYLRQSATGGKLTKADAARLMQVRFIREEPDYGLLLTDLMNPTQTMRFQVSQVGWCDGCFGQDPPPRYLGIEDRLSGLPLIHLQVGPLVLRGIEKKEIRR